MPDLAIQSGGTRPAHVGLPDPGHTLIHFFSAVAAVGSQLCMSEHSEAF